MFREHDGVLYYELTVQKYSTRDSMVRLTFNKYSTNKTLHADGEYKVMPSILNEKKISVEVKSGNESLRQ